MIRVFLLIVLLLASNLAYSIEKQEFEFNIPDNITVEEYKQDLVNWKNSLIRNLGYVESKITQEVFLRTDIELRYGGKKTTGSIYQSLNNRNRFYMPVSKTIIDFDRKLVGTMGVSGISNHITRSKRMVVVLAPQKNTSLLGVTLDFTVKTDVPEPEFSSKSVKFIWYALENNG